MDEDRAVWCTSGRAFLSTVGVLEHGAGWLSSSIGSATPSAQAHARHPCCGTASGVLVIEALVRALELVPHPEGGWYRETYRAPLTVDLGGRKRASSTAIYFLLGSGDFSALHRIAADEVWHFYEGQDLEIVSLDEQSLLRRQRLGRDPRSGAVPQLVVPAGRWFGARLAEPAAPDAFALVGCTVAPGFDFADFELGTRADLTRRFPEHAELICRWTRG